VSVDGKGGVIASARMSYVIGAATNAAIVPGINDVENQRRVEADGWVQTARRVPGPIADACDILTIHSCRMQRDGGSANGDNVAAIHQTAKFDLKPFDGRIDVTSCATGGCFFAKHVPRLESLAEFEIDVLCF